VARTPKRKLPFVLVSTQHGALIMSRLDFQPGDRNGNQLLEWGMYEPHEVSCLLELLEIRRRHYGDGVFAIDCGANIGIHTIEWSKLMTQWGWVLSIEAQERLYYALAGNVALNNCFNVQAIHAAVGKADGVISIPKLDFFQPARYGSLELKQRQGTEFIGQNFDYQKDLARVQAIRLDSLPLNRVDLIKMDVEGMELETLEGAANLLEKHKPFLAIEIIKSDREKLTSFLTSLGYTVRPLGMLDILAVHSMDKALKDIEQRDWSGEGKAA
jgi:FkbM family methyltransferase